MEKSLTDEQAPNDPTIQNEINAQFIEKHIVDGNLKTLSDKMQATFNDSTLTPVVISQAMDILSMYLSIESAMKKVSQADRTRIEWGASQRGLTMKFEGFNKKQTSLAMVALFLVQNTKQFQTFADRAMSSDSEFNNAYSRMLDVYDSINGSKRPNGLQVEDLDKLSLA